MIINKRIDEFIIDNKMSIKTALKKIDDSNNQIIFERLIDYHQKALK